MPVHTCDFWTVILIASREKKDQIIQSEKNDKPTVLSHQAHSMLKALPLKFILSTLAAKEHFVYSPVTNL